jgi:hypothetical protein
MLLSLGVLNCTGTGTIFIPQPVMGVSNFSLFKGTVQRKLTWVKSGINRKLIISSIVAGYLFKKFLQFCPFKFKETVFGVLQNF